MITFIVALFVIGYLCIALESVLKINKAAPALLMCVGCWVLYMLDAGSFIQSFRGVSVAAADVSQWVNEHILLSHLGDTCEILFFLMGAMTIVEIVDANGGFNFVRDRLQTKHKHTLLWRVTFMTFVLSAVLDNLTTSIVMIMVLRKLVKDHKDRLIYASCIKELLIPSIISVVVPTFLLQFKLKGQLETNHTAEAGDALHFSRLERNMVFFIGVGGLIFVPIFRFLTGLPPFMGILLVLGLLWSITEFFYRSKGHVDESMQMRVTQLLKRIDMSTILFFLGILMAVATLQETGVLRTFGQALNEASGGNHYIVTGVIGVVSSIVDNVPLVAGCMGMYDIQPGTDFAVDGIFWQLLAYCAGVGGSMLIIGSAAGVVVMGLEKITFGWYMRHITWIAFVGYLAGIGAYAVEKMLGM